MPDYCIDGCPHADNCYYNAIRIYLNNENDIGCRDYCTDKVNPTDDDTIVSGHGGGDRGVVSALYEYIAEDRKVEWLSEIQASVQNHLATFAAEKSRPENRVIDVIE